MAGDSCLIRTYPIPPPTAERSQADTCGPPLCPSGGVIYTIVGRASVGSLIVAENLTRHRGDGSRYTATAWTEPLASSGDGGTGDASVDDAGLPPSGTFTLTFSPVPDPGGAVTVSQIGDRISLVQFVRNDQGLWQQGMSAELTVGP